MQYVPFELPGYNEKFVTVALKDTLPYELYIPMQRAVQKYVTDVVENTLFGRHTFRTAHENFLKVMHNLKVAGVELAQRTQVERDERQAICQSNLFYEFTIVVGDEFTRRTLIHAAYESFALKVITDFVAAHRGEVADMYMHERLLYDLQNAAQLLVPNHRYGNRNGTLEFQRESIYVASEDVPSSFAERQRPSFRRPVPVHVGYKYHFYTPTHNFQIYISNDFRSLEMETCRAEGIDDWLPQSIHPQMN